MGFPRRGGPGAWLSAYEFFCVVKKFPSLRWILKADEDSEELKQFMTLFNRIRKLYTDFISFNQAVELYPSYKFDIGIPWLYCKEVACIILDCMRYKPWNQFYYSQMGDERLTQMIDLANKEYKQRFLIDSISQDFD